MPVNRPIHHKPKYIRNVNGQHPVAVWGPYNVQKPKLWASLAVKLYRIS